MPRRLPAAPTIWLLASLAGCGTLRNQVRKLGIAATPDETTVLVRTDGGVELGVSTDYGLVFLGRGAQRGRVQLEVPFLDGPSFETSMIEPVGGGLYTAQTEIRLPSVPLSFESPGKGTKVTVVGRRRGKRWEVETEVDGHPKVDGILLDAAAFDSHLDGSQVGAGVYVERDERRMLLGLVSGRLRLRVGGRTREFVTVIGPEDLWRLVTYRRDPRHHRRWVYREDIL